ncbi:MFS transporter [Altererythrobacter sp. Root672]|uniref:MFS transporter n=1 Tax=Altererythrobacter sp. Root672 TaxID=1736584 RepID=UPI000701FF95|nr:MFS transporter [Altererythrobacter sp. Root672]KRA84161.1 D-galactonate transporter DgoT [Altererythrobacter sp. Root672]
MSYSGTIQSSQRATKARLGILALISFATLLNYLDRAVMGVAAPSMTEELKISPEVMGLIFSAFSWTYAAAQIPGGIVLDRLGTRITYGASLLLWSVATFFHGIASNVGMLLGFRLALGVAEAPCFPCNSRILSTWFPQDERARANSVFAVGQYAGLAFFSPVLFWIVGAYGWRSLFFIAGGIGILFGLAMYGLYREPHQSKRANQAELEHIKAGGGLAVSASAPSEPFSWSNVRRLLSQRQILGASIGQFCGNSTLVFFLTWFPTYLATERGMDWIKSGVYAVLPYIAASVGVLLGGYVSDVLLRRTASANIARKLPIVTGLLLASTIIAANYVDDNLIIIAIMSVAFFGQGMVNLGWTLISDVAPKQLIGLTGGVFNLCANLAGIVTPIVIGIIVGQTGSFYGALAFIGVLALVGAASYVFVIGDVKRIELQ